MFEVDVSHRVGHGAHVGVELVGEVGGDLAAVGLEGDGVRAEESHGHDVVDEGDELAVHGVEDPLCLRAVGTNTGRVNPDYCHVMSPNLEGARRSPGSMSNVPRPVRPDTGDDSPAPDPPDGRETWQSLRRGCTGGNSRATDLPHRDHGRQGARGGALAHARLDGRHRRRVLRARRDPAPARRLALRRGRRAGRRLVDLRRAHRPGASLRHSVPRGRGGARHRAQRHRRMGVRAGSRVRGVAEPRHPVPADRRRLDRPGPRPDRRRLPRPADRAGGVARRRAQRLRRLEHATPDLDHRHVAVLRGGGRRVRLAVTAAAFGRGRHRRPSSP